MTYKVNRALGYQSWGVTNPFVFANYGQPQRHRGYVSPMVFQTHAPQLKNPHLGQTVDFLEEDRRRARRMEWIAIASLGVSVWSMWFFYQKMQKPTPNRRRQNRRGMKSNPDGPDPSEIGSVLTAEERRDCADLWGKDPGKLTAAERRRLRDYERRLRRSPY